MTESTPKEISSRPLIAVTNALERASRGTSPYQEYGGDSSAFRRALLNKLELDTDTRDGKPLMARFVSRAHRFRDYRQILGVQDGIYHLLDSALQGQANSFQEQLGTDLAAVAARQFEREGEVCPGVSGMVLLSPDKFLEEFPGLRERVFEKDVDQTVTAGRGKIEEGRIVSHSFLEGFGLTPPTHQDFIQPTGNIFVESSHGVLRSVHPSPINELSEYKRNNMLADTLDVLPLLWIQQSGEETPHPLIPDTARRSRRR